MKNIVILVILLFVLASCKYKNSEYTSFGEKITSDNAQAPEALALQYMSMNEGDSIDFKLVAKVDKVCQEKGCWMTLSLENGHQVTVKFKDYGFFVPKDISGKEVIVEGKAYINEMSVEELRHFAEDAGESEKDIAQIDSPEKSYSFEAVGVLLKQ